MKELTVQDLIDISQAEKHLQEPLAVARALNITLDELRKRPASEYMACKAKVLEMNGLD